MFDSIPASHFLPGGHRLGKGDADLGFTRSDDGGARTTERWGVAKMGAPNQDARLQITSSGASSHPPDFRISPFPA